MEQKFRRAWGSKVTFLVSLAEPLPPAAIDAASLRQILEQLLNNAGEAIPERGVVTLSARNSSLDQDGCLELLGNARPGAHIEITITDTGNGLNEETRRRLFSELFYSTKTRHRGLGLAMVYGILQACHGGLRFGPDPEQGTAVRVFVPVAATAQPASPAPLPLREIGPLLAVDDDPVVLELVCRVLENAGYRVKAAPGPGEALDCYTAAHEPYRLVISDVIMPLMNGFELARKLRAVDAAANFLFITSHAPAPGSTEDIAREFPLLRKPFEPADLIDAVARALAAHPATPARTSRNLPLQAT
jgi:CheY-like chemotaxis protein